jgi:hypothetical protein
MNPQELQLELVLTTGEQSEPKEVFIRQARMENRPLLQIVQRAGKKEKQKIVPLGEHTGFKTIQHENKEVDFIFEYEDLNNPGKPLSYCIKNIFEARVIDQSEHFKDAHHLIVHGDDITFFAFSYFKWASGSNEPDENSIVNVLERFKEMGKADKKD